MSTQLLDIPLEIREQIFIQAVLAHKSAAPVDAASLANAVTDDSASPSTTNHPIAQTSDQSRGGDVTQSHGNRRFKFGFWYHRDSSSVRAKPLEGPVQSLLLLNKQVNLEVRKIVARNRGRALLDCTVDIMFVKNWGFLMTWLQVPLPTTRFGTIHAQFRLFNFPTTWDNSLFGEESGEEEVGDYPEKHGRYTTSFAAS